MTLDHAKNFVLGFGVFFAVSSRTANWRDGNRALQVRPLENLILAGVIDSLYTLGVLEDALDRCTTTFLLAPAVPVKGIIELHGKGGVLLRVIDARPLRVSR